MPKPSSSALDSPSPKEKGRKDCPSMFVTSRRSPWDSTSTRSSAARIAGMGSVSSKATPCRLVSRASSRWAGQSAPTSTAHRAGWAGRARPPASASKRL